MSEITASAGGVTELERLYRLHAGSLLKLAVLLTGDAPTAEEVLHDAFLRYHRRGHPEPGKELAYLRRIVVNLSRSHHRRLRVVARTPRPTVSHAEAADAAAVRTAVREQVVAVVRSLPERQRECVVLHYFDQLSDSEIAGTLGVSRGSVKTHLHRARQRLQRDLEDLA